MPTRKPMDLTQQLLSVRMARLGDLTAFTVHEHDLDIIAAGSPATLAFNFAVALISIGVTFILTLTTTTIASERLFYGYLIVCVNYWIIGIIMSVYWLKTRTSVQVTVKKIISRVVVAPLIQQHFNPDSTATPEDPSS